MVSVPKIEQQTNDHSRFADSHPADVENPPFDPRRYSTNPYYGNLQQGVLVRTEIGQTNTSIFDKFNSKGKGNGDVPNSVKLRFLYNPSDLTESGSPSDRLFPQSSGDNSDDDFTIAGQTNVSISFSLLFDRTYEVNSGLNPIGDVTQFSHVTGVSTDVLVFKWLMGVPSNGKGLPQYYPLRLYLGGVSSPSFYGVISGYSIAYSHFSVNMVPMRAAISIGMTQWLGDSEVDDTAPSPKEDPHTTNKAPRAGSGHVASTTVNDFALPNFTFF